MCDHLLQATTYPKTKIFPVKILWSQPLVNDGLTYWHCDQFLAWRFNSCRVVFNLLQATTWIKYQGSFRFRGAKIWNIHASSDPEERAWFK